MSGRLSFRWIWVVLAGALACIPAEAQYGYSSIDIDSYGNIAGMSLTEVPYYFPDFGYDAYVEGTLNGPDEDEIMDVIAYDNGEGLAEVDTDGTASGNGDYAQVGYHEVVTDDEYESEDIGTTDADADWEGTTCEWPDYDSTTVLGVPVNAPTRSAFDMYPIILNDFNGRNVAEDFGGGTNSSCTAMPGGISLADDLRGVWTVGSGFWGPDYNGFGLTQVDTFRDSGWVPCGFDIYQDVYMNCAEPADWTYYTTHEILVSVDATTLTVVRDGMYGGTWNYPE